MGVGAGRGLGITDEEKKRRKTLRETRATSRHRKLHPERQQARCKAWEALKSGRIKKKPCEVCGSILSQMHHDDYSKPLKVRWLCRKHHFAEHKRKREKIKK